MIAGAAVIVGSATAWAQQQQPNGRKAEQILEAMANRLAGSKSLKVEVTRDVDPALARETRLPEHATISVSVMRPDRIRARSVADRDVRLFLFDGKQVTVLDEKMNVYASAAAPGSIDDMSERLEQRFGFTVPLAELLSNKPAEAIRSKARFMGYGGEQTVNGQQCHRLTIRGDHADAELFVSTKDSLPCQLVATFTDTTGNPKLRMSFSDWQLNAPVDEKSFAFTPPRKAQEVEMVPVEALTPPADAPSTPAPQPAR